MCLGGPFIIIHDAFSIFSYIQPIMGTFGLFGNLLSILVLSAHQMKNSFNRLLIALAIFDSIFIIFVVLDYTFIRGNRGGVTARNNQISCCIVWHWPISEDSTVYAYLLPKVIYPLNNISLCCSIYTTIVIAFERFYKLFSDSSIASPCQVHCCVQSISLQGEQCCS